MAHTPGPWRFLMEEDGDEETGGYGVDVWDGYIVAPCDPKDGSDGVGYEEICNVWPRDEANGRLICAAPDLLAACELAERFYVEVRSTSHLPLTDELKTEYVEASIRAMRACVAAARKARGESE
jgi:hypothetical protein